MTSIAIVAFPRLTALDAVGPYEVLSRVPGAEVVIVGHRRGEVRTDTGSLGITVDATFAELTAPDVVVVPGGPGQSELMDDAELVGWLATVHRSTTWTTSVCTGSLLLGAAGLLKGVPATSHWLALDHLAHFGARPTAERVVTDGRIITAAGVSAGIDMGLVLAAHLAGDQVAQTIQLGIEYDPHPPFDAGSPGRAPATSVDWLRARSRFETSTSG